MASVNDQLNVGEEERKIQKCYWIEHSQELTVEAMMLDSHASDLDKEERPEARDFSAIWISWMKQCITTASFSVLVDGRGVARCSLKEESISSAPYTSPPMLFKSMALPDALKRHAGPASLVALQAGCFFCCSMRMTLSFSVERYELEARRVAILVEIFGVALGLEINHAKSTFIPFGMVIEDALSCAAKLLTLVGALPITYLGLPLSDRHTGSAGWTPVIESLEHRLQGWSSRLLSSGGRLVLLRSVLSVLL